MVSRRDFLPFGEDLLGGIGSRTQALKYDVADNIRQKFTGKQRDNETNLDFFEARYFSARWGRFTSPDEFTGGAEELIEFDGMMGHNPTFYAELAEPQSLNKYQYALNNPLRYIDPDGHQTAVADAARAGRDIAVLPHPVAKAIGYILIGGAAVAAAASEVDWGKVAKTIGNSLATPSSADPSCPACNSSERMGQYIMNKSADSGKVEANAGGQVSSSASGSASSSGGKNKKKITAEKADNLRKSEQQGIPKSQLSGSGKPRINIVKMPTSKRAKDFARNRGGGKPIKDVNPQKGKSHYHPTKKDGSKKTGKDNLHVEFPLKGGKLPE